MDKQIDTLFSKLELFAEEYDESHKSTLKLKRSIVTVLMRHSRHDVAIRLLEEILVNLGLFRRLRKKYMALLRCTWERH